MRPVGTIFVIGRAIWIWGSTRGLRDLCRFGEEILAWIWAKPRPLNRVDQFAAARFHETGDELIAELVSAIACGQHVAVAGPRGCGKSHCIDQAIRVAEEQGFIPKNGFVKLQGNRELPRDYLIEDDMTLAVEDGVVVPKRKDAPLFRFALRVKEGDRRGRPVRSRDGYVSCYGLDDNSNLCLEEALKRHQRIVLFLDEVNRFSDGVLDSLLLLLEEGEVVMGGEIFKLPVVVMMTMNPPGYDASARALSPPLSARIGRQYRLLSPRLNVLTDVIAYSVVRELINKMNKDVGSEIALLPPSINLIRRAAAVTLCAWGDPRSKDPCFEYLSSEMHDLLIEMAKSSPAVASAMQTLNELCHFGPDGRALGDWIVAASVGAIKESRVMKRSKAVPEATHFIASAVTVLSHKLQDNFSSATRPDNTQRKEEALHLLASSILTTKSERIERLLLRRVDQYVNLQDMMSGLVKDLSATDVRETFIEYGIASNRDVERWIEFLGAVKVGTKGIQNRKDVERIIKQEMRNVGFLEVHEEGLAFADDVHRRLLGWLSEHVFHSLLRTVFSELASGTPAVTEPLERALEECAFVRDGIWKEHATVRRLIQQEGLVDLSRERVSELFHALDACWLRAEHQNVDLVEPLEEVLKAVNQDKELQENIKRFVGRSLKQMAKHPGRGKGTRGLSRMFEDKYKCTVVSTVISTQNTVGCKN